MNAPATAMAWDAASRPPRAGQSDTEARCLVCGRISAATEAAKTACGANFDYLSGRGQGSDRVCVPCAWAMAGKPPATLRLWSIAVTASTTLPASQDGAPYPSDGRLHLCNRRDMAAIVALLTDPPADRWAVAVAVSGQKHLLPYTPVNAGRGPWVVRFEAADVFGVPETFAHILGSVAALRVAGHSPDAIAAAQPSVTALKGEGMTAWKTHLPTIRPHAGSLLIDLAVHLTTKETIHDLANRFACDASHR